MLFTPFNELGSVVDPDQVGSENFPKSDSDQKNIDTQHFLETNSGAWEKSEKLDPDPKKIISDPQHWSWVPPANALYNNLGLVNSVLWFLSCSV